MGGLMSGFQGRRKLTTAEVLKLNVNKLGIKKNNKFTGSVEWKNGAKIGIRKQNEDYINLIYSITTNGEKKKYDYEIALDYTSCNYGNERVWFLCPQCGERVGMLYLKDGYFFCRSCQNLNYILQQEDIRDREMRSIDHKMYKIQDKLKTKRDIDNCYHIPKPKGMHWKTYEELTFKLRWLYLKREQTFCKIMEGFGYSFGLF